MVSATNAFCGLGCAGCGKILRVPILVVFDCRGTACRAPTLHRRTAHSPCYSGQSGLPWDVDSHLGLDFPEFACKISSSVYVSAGNRMNECDVMVPSVGAWSAANSPEIHSSAWSSRTEFSKSATWVRPSRIFNAARVPRRLCQKLAGLLMEHGPWEASS